MPGLLEQRNVALKEFEDLKVEIQVLNTAGAALLARDDASLTRQVGGLKEKVELTKTFAKAASLFDSRG